MTIGQILNRWKDQLDEDLSLFHREASRMAEMDHKLMEYRTRIEELEKDVVRVDTEQRQMEGNLDDILLQQKAMDDELKQLEEWCRTQGLAAMSSTGQMQRGSMFVDLSLSLPPSLVFGPCSHSHIWSRE